MRKLLAPCVLFALLAHAPGCPSPKPDPLPLPEPQPSASPRPPGLRRIFGLTLDSVDNLPAIIASLKALPKKALVRIVFDYPNPPSDYTAAVRAISPYAEIVGQPADSTYLAKMTTAQYEARFRSYVDAFPEIQIWETCNECNGDWAGKNTPAQAEAATRAVKASGRYAMFTPYWNTPSCADAHGPYITWTQNNISAYVKANTDLVTPSIYGFDCDGPEPSYETLDRELAVLGNIFPNAQIGIGEYGKEGNASVLRHYLAYTNADPRYVFAGFYWYGAQDFVPRTKPLWKIFAEAMNR